MESVNPKRGIKNRKVRAGPFFRDKHSDFRFLKCSFDNVSLISNYARLKEQSIAKSYSFRIS